MAWIAGGGFPEALARRSAKRRHKWFESYLATVIQRDIRDLSAIQGFADLPRLLRLLAARETGLLSYSELARDAAVAQTTLKRYVALLRGIFLVQMVPAWSTNLTKRAVKSPKVLLVDTGLTLHLLGRDRVEPNAPRAGALLEAFVAHELQKLCDWDEASVELFHFRTHTGREIDWVLERADGSVVGIEVKLAGHVRASDLKGLFALREAAGDRFRRGIVMYSGSEPVSFGDRVQAVPIGNLWDG
ncbi:MAG: DUF4143 domain-containing protein [Myxococcota bacterium]